MVLIWPWAWGVGVVAKSVLFLLQLEFIWYWKVVVPRVLRSLLKQETSLCPDGRFDDNQPVMSCAAWDLILQVTPYDTHPMEYISLTAAMTQHTQDCDSRWQMGGKLKNTKPSNRSVEQTVKLSLFSDGEEELQGREP